MKPAIIIFVLLILFSLSLLTPASCFASAVSNLVVTNVLERGFTVSWTSAEKEKGSVSFGVSTSLGTSSSDARGVDITSNTHYVMIGNLIPSTKYYFTVTSGTTVDNNNGNLYSVTTGPVLSVPPSDISYGKILDSNNAAFNGAIVYATIVDSDNQGSSGRSFPLSGLSNSNGGWTINLGNSRINSLSSYFVYSPGDKLEIKFFGGNSTRAEKIVNISSVKPVMDVKLEAVSQTNPTSTPAPNNPIITPTPTFIPAPVNGLDFPGFIVFVFSLSVMFLGLFIYLLPQIPAVRRRELNNKKEKLEDVFSK